MLFIGIDLGTSSVKLLLTDEHGNIYSSVTEPYPVYYPRAGWSEQNPADWYTKTMHGLKALLRDCDRSQIRGIGIAGQMHGLVVLDRNGKVLRPAILWNDGRSAEETDYLNTEIGKDILSRRTGNIAFAGFTAPKLLWMQHHEPELFARIDKIMLPKDYLFWRLTGEAVTDPSDASGTLYFDVRNRCWSEPMLELLQLSRSHLPEVQESFAPAGTLLPELCRELGLNRVTLAAGAGDNAGAAIGTGTAAPGTCNLSLGTSGTLFLPCADFRQDPQNALHAFAHANGGYHLMGCMLSAAACGKWWTEDILKTDYALSLRGKHSIYFLPYLMGERSPHNDPDARGVFFGLAMDTSREDMTAAVYEGVTFGIRDSLEAAKAAGVTPKQATICGGGARSPAWRQLCADVLNLPVARPVVEEGPSYGAAILSMVACGIYPTTEAAAAEIIRLQEPLLPDPQMTAFYDEKYQTWRQLYPALKSMFQKLPG